MAVEPDAYSVFSLWASALFSSARSALVRRVATHAWGKAPGVGSLGSDTGTCMMFPALIVVPSFLLILVGPCVAAGLDRGVDIEARVAYRVLDAGTVSLLETALHVSPREGIGICMMHARRAVRD